MTARRVSQRTERTAEQAAVLNQRAIEVGQQTAGTYLDAYEKAWLSITHAYESAARATNVDWIATVASAQASQVREVAQAQTSTVRELVS